MRLKIEIDVEAHGASERLLGCKVVHEISKSLKKVDWGKRLRKLTNPVSCIYNRSGKVYFKTFLTLFRWVAFRCHSQTALNRETRLTFLVTLANLKSFIEPRHSRVSQTMTPQIWPTQESVSVHLIRNTVLTWRPTKSLPMYTTAHQDWRPLAVLEASHVCQWSIHLAVLSSSAGSYHCKHETSASRGHSM